MVMDFSLHIPGNYVNKKIPADLRADMPSSTGYQIVSIKTNRKILDADSVSQLALKAKQYVDRLEGETTSGAFKNLNTVIKPDAYLTDERKRKLHKFFEEHYFMGPEDAIGTVIDSLKIQFANKLFSSYFSEFYERIFKSNAIPPKINNTIFDALSGYTDTNKLIENIDYLHVIIYEQADGLSRWKTNIMDIIKQNYDLKDFLVCNHSNISITVREIDNLFNRSAKSTSTSHYSPYSFVSVSAIFVNKNSDLDMLMLSLDKDFFKETKIIKLDFKQFSDYREKCNKSVYMSFLRY